MARGMDRGTLEAIKKKGAIGQVGERVVEGVVFQLFLDALACGDVAIDDDEVGDVSLPIADGISRGFENSPAAVLMTHAIFELLADTGGARLLTGFDDQGAIFGMNSLPTPLVNSQALSCKKDCGKGVSRKLPPARSCPRHFR
jgi:hypothetical protein